MLKKTGFKQKTYKEKLETQRLKREGKFARIKGVKKKVKKVKKLSVSKLHKLVWEECRRIAQDMPATCYTCGATNLTGHNKQLGHGLSKGSLSLRYKYDLRNLKWQDMRCNIHRQGEQEIFLRRLEKETAGLEFLNDAGYKDENGAWRCKKEEPIQAYQYLTNLLEVLKTL